MYMVLEIKICSERKYSNTLFPDPPHHPQNQKKTFTDTHQETVNYSQNLFPHEQKFLSVFVNRCIRRLEYNSKKKYV
jgi:hypothetical protein